MKNASATTSQTADAKPRRSPRDHRIDWLRGLALVSIFINHMPGNRAENLTSRNFGFSDAAEVFVLLAGVSAALAYFPRFARGEQAAVGFKALKRAGVLYGAHLVSTLAAVLIFGCGAWLLADTGIYELIGIAPVLDDPLAALTGVATGGVQLGYFNILPLYVFLLLLVPGLLWLAVRDLRLLLGVSLAVYLGAHHLPVRLPNYPTDGGWYFNPFAWQLIYSIGLALGIMRLRGQSVPWHPLAGLVAAAYAIYAAVWMIFDLGGQVSFGLLPAWVDTLHKPMLPPSRLAHVLALSYLLVHSRLWTWLAGLSPNNIFVRLGRHSLPVFVLGSLLSMVGYITLQYSGPLLWLEAVITVTGVLLMVALAQAFDTGVFRRLRKGARTWIVGTASHAWTIVIQRVPPR